MKTSTIIYIGHFMSSWGDRMWYFAIPLFLIDLDPSSLFLTAAYGLALAASVLLFAPLVGDWIDRKKRLYAVTVSLVIQNMSVALSAAILIVNREYGDHHASYAFAVQGSAILLGAVGMLASTATGICIQKDWIVVIASGRTDYLADLNAMVRRIDLVTKILSPLACGQIMTITTLTGGAIFIVAWNTISMFTEYFLLKMVYKRTPALATKGETADSDEEVQLAVIEENNPDVQKIENGNGEEVEMNKNKKSDAKTGRKTRKKKKKTVFQKMFGFILIIKDGWKLYHVQSICKAGIALSFLFMTVLGFGYVTTSYAYNQCFSEFLVGVLLAASAVAGIIGTYAFPIMRTKFGLVKTGLYSGIFQVLTLIPCLVSVFVEGSPFYLLPANQVTVEAATNSPLSMPGSFETPYTNNLSVTDTFASFALTTSSPIMYTTTHGGNHTDNYGLSPKLFFKCMEGVRPPTSFLSLSLLMAGNVIARAGLWGFDLTVTQLIQENVAETERGIVNGVQTSLNMLMDLLNFVLVLFLPRPDQFGILIMISCVTVTTGHMTYAVFAKQAGNRFDGNSKKPKKPKESKEKENSTA